METAEKSSQKLPELPTGLDEFINHIDWQDERNKQHLKDIVAMVREGAPELWQAKYIEHKAWHESKRRSHQEENRKMPEQWRDPEIREYADEYYWLESAVALGEELEYLSKKDNKAADRF